MFENAKHLCQGLEWRSQNSKYHVGLHVNKVSPWRDVTLLAHRVLSLVSYVAPWRVTDTDRRQTTTETRRAKQYWPPTLCVGGPVISKD